MPFFSTHLKASFLITPMQVNLLVTAHYHSTQIRQATGIGVKNTLGITQSWVQFQDNASLGPNITNRL